MNDDVSIYPPVIPKMEDWPINRQSEDRNAFINEIDNYTIDRFLMKPTEKVSDILARTIYLERIRIKEEPWKVDPPNEALFWKKIQKKLVGKSLDKEEQEARVSNEEILKKIVHRYSEEIVGTFSTKTFLFARKFLTFFFNRLLNTASERNFRRIWGGKHRVYDRLKVKGEIDILRSLFDKGTVVIVPTHYSNLDSILIGYAVDAVLGLPAFSYGAGLNLYNTGYTAYYMNRLGAYRLDRRKKNPIYLETLKAMSKLSIERGTNNLFFPGGTRSRSGAIETKLKMGLLGTAVEAQRALSEKGKQEKVFIVPLVLGYHFVLEAKYLIDQHLKKTGKEKYIKTKDQSGSVRSLLKFAWKFFSDTNDITLTFGKPMDVLGNFVDSNGESFDKFGNKIDIADYFKSGHNKVQANFQREAEYTKILADKIVERFHKDNMVLSSYVVAYVAFNILKIKHPKLDLYGVLRLPTNDFIFSYQSILEGAEQLRTRLFEMEANEDIRLSEEIRWDIDKLVKDGIERMGTFHAQSPLKITKSGQVVSEDFKLLFYYHNSLENYNLSKYVKWNNLELQLVDTIK